jgi:hypothetical protein
MDIYDYLLLAVIVLGVAIVRPVSATDLNLRYLAPGGLGIGNVLVSVYNSTDLEAQNLTDINGRISFQNVSTDEVNVTASYPSSAYSAVLENLTLNSPYLNDILTASAKLHNTLGTPLEAQDCSVFSLDSSGILVHKWDTTCRQDSTYINNLGNYVAISNCTLTDSAGYYSFQGSVMEQDGFKAGENYTLVMVCNAQELTGTFQVGNVKTPDVNRYADYISQNSGLIFLLGVVGFLGLIVLIVLALAFTIVF